MERERGDGFYSLAQWRHFRRRFLAVHLYCIICQAEGRVEIATDVDHKIRRWEQPGMEFDEDNCQALCKACHSKKSQRERRIV